LNERVDSNIPTTLPVCWYQVLVAAYRIMLVVSVHNSGMD